MAQTAAGMPNPAPHPADAPCRRRTRNVPGRFVVLRANWLQTWRPVVGGLIYLIGLIVVILFILSFLGLR